MSILHDTFSRWFQRFKIPEVIDGDDYLTIERRLDTLTSQAAKANSSNDILHHIKFYSGYANVEAMMKDIARASVAVQQNETIPATLRKTVVETNLDQFFLDDENYPLDIYQVVQQIHGLTQDLIAELKHLELDNSRKSYYVRILSPLFKEIRIFSNALNLVP